MTTNLVSLNNEYLFTILDLKLGRDFVFPREPASSLVDHQERLSSGLSPGAQGEDSLFLQHFLSSLRTLESAFARFSKKKPYLQETGASLLLIA
ncbi:hypothetical protein VNO77_04338 [Canavalia gladiata]|uniref:Uncharacterized protein n=1 Tax=Canavalia gladiata TaxID=3824 RepID=A0AAN9MWC2_CANGL